MSKGLWIEIGMTGSAFLSLVIYHVSFFYQVREHPMSTSLGLANHLRREWVLSIMETKQHIEAIQTLRNWVMASSFFASTAILIGLGIVSAVVKTEKIAECSQVLNIWGTKSAVLWLAKLMVLIVNFFFAFFNFALTIRYYNHAGFIINIPPADDPLVTYESTTGIINRANIHYTLGMRAFYLAVPFTLWLFGPTWLLIGAIMLTIVLHKLDRTI